jgi:hypothetical protein
VAECNAAELNGVSFTKGCYVGQEKHRANELAAEGESPARGAPADAPGPPHPRPLSELGLAVEHRRIDDLGDA